MATRFVIVAVASVPYLVLRAAGDKGKESKTKDCGMITRFPRVTPKMEDYRRSRSPDGRTDYGAALRWISEFPEQRDPFSMNIGGAASHCDNCRDKRRTHPTTRSTFRLQRAREPFCVILRRPAVASHQSVHQTLLSRNLRPLSGRARARP